MEGLVLGFSHRWALTPDKPYKRWDIVLGKVIQIEPDGAWIDIGVEKLIYVPLEQLVNTSCYPNLSANEVLSLNQSYEFIVDIYSVDNNDYGTVLISFLIIKVNNNGSLIVDVEGIHGYVPSTQISDFHLETPREQLIGKKLDLEILEVGDEYSDRFILSHSMPIKKRALLD